MNELNSGNSKRNKGNVEMLRLGLGFLELVFSSFFVFFFLFCNIQQPIPICYGYQTAYIGNVFDINLVLFVL